MARVKTHKYSIGAVVILVLSIAAYSYAKNQYYPKDLIVRSEAFIHLIHEKKLASAYDLTTKQGTYYDFSSAQLFKEAVDRQARNFLYAKRIDVVYRGNFPPQTYGNRVRRWLAGRELNTKQKSIDFFIKTGSNVNAQSSTAFEVRWALQADKSSKIVFFQSHAW